MSLDSVMYQAASRTKGAERQPRQLLQARFPLIYAVVEESWQTLPLPSSPPQHA